ncbi:hypothetical protein C6W27_09030 [Bacillus paralicheniformis]|uniref:hypothetical protein n=1 Tax=Bacillus paralicheniformis TaxID=1648923 RepID=UPI000D02D2A1|nr:hypothetical protein [Bacillus paralicheniformis]PRS16534.1 hypothetical protein C6W27_09030 [Bacillus paralicheniformis]
MKNYFEKKRNKTFIYTEDGTPVIVDTDQMKRIEDRIRNVYFDEKGFPMATATNGKKIPFSLFVVNAKKNEHVFFKNGRNDCRKRSLEITQR